MTTCPRCKLIFKHPGHIRSGCSKSHKKAIASRINGAKGGRPRKTHTTPPPGGREMTHAITHLPHQPVPHLPPAVAATGRPTRRAANQVPPGAMPADSAATTARRTGSKVACAECGAKATDTCKTCGKRLCGMHSFVHTVDESNASITRHSGTVCVDCHPETIATKAKIFPTIVC